MGKGRNIGELLNFPNQAGHDQSRVRRLETAVGFWGKATLLGLGFVFQQQHLMDHRDGCVSGDLCEGLRDRLTDVLSVRSFASQDDA